MNRAKIEQHPEDPRGKHLQKLVEDLAAKKHIPHVILAVESADRSFCWSGAVGQASPVGTPVTARTPFFIASIDKTIVATVVLKLHEQQFLSIDDSIANYLAPELIRGLHHLHGTDYTTQITIRNLLGHTSGLPDYLEDYPRKGPSLVERIFEGEDRDLSLEEMLQILKEDLTPHFPPQPIDALAQKVRYSDTNFQLLGEIVEAVCKKPLHEAVAENIFDPLDLRHTWHAGLTEPKESTAPPASLWVADNTLERPRLLRSLHSIYSTTGDLVVFMRALMFGELFDDQGTFGLMQGRWNRFGFPRDKWGKLKKSDTNVYPISGGVQHEQEIEWPLLQRVQERGRETGC